MKSLQGHLLVASPQLTHSMFSQTVVLLLHHSDQGAFGLVLNRPIEQTVAQLWSKVSDQPAPSEQRLHMGGPVQGPVVALHQQDALGEVEIPPGIFLAADKGHLDTLVHQSDSPYRLYIGHAGWTEGQLEAELAQGVWLTLRAKSEHVFSEDDDLWRHALQEIGWAVLNSSLQIKHVPAHVSLN
jgi:putative transcriptional regulator